MTAESTIQPREVLRFLAEHRRRWLIPTVAIALVVGLYALVRRPTWEASQALIIREAATADDRRPGSFSDVTEMKTVQETILELARSKSVLKAALVAVGPPVDASPGKPWPSDEDVADLRDSLKLTPPNGAEFGKTEVFYLKLRDKDRARAVALADEVCLQLEHGFQELRDAKLKSMVDELVNSEKIAEAKLAEATVELAALETKVGPDLAELRMLHSSASSGSDLRQRLVEVQNEIRKYTAEKVRNEQLLDVLHDAAADPGRLLATPSSLLESQPALKRLKDGLVDAQLETSKLSGTRAPEHPQVRVAIEAEGEISRELHGELAIATKGVQIDLRLNANRLAALQDLLKQGESRLANLASLRADYANLVAKTENRTNLLETARRNLVDAEASKAAVRSVSLLSRIDSPDTGTRPIGPGKTTLGLAGIFGGLMCGLGVVFLTTGPLTRSNLVETPPHVEVAPVMPLAAAPLAAAPVAADPRELAPSAQTQAPAPAVIPFSEGVSFGSALQKLWREPRR